MRRAVPPKPPTYREACEKLRVEDLKPLVQFLGARAASRKPDLVAALVKGMKNPQVVRAQYAELGDLERLAVQAATHDPLGVVRRPSFVARFGDWPAMSAPGPRPHKSSPTRVRLFLPCDDTLPSDLRATLLDMVAPPPPLALAPRGELAAFDERPTPRARKRSATPVELQRRETAAAAELDVKAVLRLADVGGLEVGKAGRPSAATLNAIRPLLSEGDYYRETSDSEWKSDPAGDLVMAPFAWPMLLQAAGLVGGGGAKLELTPAGRRALARPAPEVLRDAWGEWLKSSLLDEFGRVEAIKGQGSHGALTPVAPRRRQVAEALMSCPTGVWLPVDEFFRLLQASDSPPRVALAPEKLYSGDSYYGRLDYLGDDGWPIVEGRFVLAFLFEYAATLGLLDVAYVTPAHARTDYLDGHGRIPEDYSCMSRYDGLRYFRINPLGAWCLGLAENYVPAAPAAERLFRVLPNHDVVAPGRRPAGADLLTLGRYAAPRSENVWRISAAHYLTAIEQGAPPAELREFLRERALEQLPQPVEVFLADLEGRAGLLADLGNVRLIACKDAVLARTLASDRRLRGLCRQAGERDLVFRAGDEPAVRRALREMGHALPPPA